MDILLSKDDTLIELASSSIDFGDVIIGNTPIETVKVYNEGCNTLSITDITSTLPEYTLSTTAITILPRDSAMFDITFAPATTSTYNGEITIVNNDADQIISVTGNGIGAPEITVNPTTYTITTNGCDVIQTEPLTIYNTNGETDLEYEIEHNSEIVASGTVPVGGNVVEDITFDATGLNTGVYNLEFYVNSNDPANPVVTVPYELTVNGAPEINLSATTLDFGQVHSSSGTFDLNLEIENTGCDVLDITDISSSLTEFYPDQTALTINPGNSSTVTLTFEPLADGTYTSTLTITNNDVEQTVTLHGEGIAAGTPLIQITETQMNFGDVYLGEASAEQVYYVSGSSLTEDIVLSAPYGFQISTTSGTGFSNSITLPHTIGTVNSTAIYVRFAPTAFQTYNEAVIHTSAGATQKDLALTGNGIVPPNISLTRSQLAFEDTWNGFESTEKSYTVSGSGLSEDLIINAPTDFVISTTSGSGFTNSLSFTPAGGIVPSTDVFVKFTPNTAGDYLDDIENVSAGAATEILEVSGTSVENYVANFYVTYGANPIGGATITVDGNTLTTSGGGMASTNLLVGTHSYTVSYAGYYDYSGTVEIVDQDITENINLTIIPYDVTFNVTNGTNPIAGATVSLNGYGNQTTDATGVATFVDVTPESSIPYTVTANTYNNQTGTVDVTDSDVTENVVLNLTSYNVTFYATDGTDPIEGAIVSLAGYGDQATNSSGVTVFTGVIPATGISYTMSADGYNNATGSVDVVSSNVTETVTMTLITYEVTFNVTDGASAIEGATISLTGYGDQVTGAGGTATFTGIVPENGIAYTVTATDYDDATGTVDVVNSNVTENVSMTLATFEVLFTVTDGAYPIVGATVSIDGETLTTDTNGETTINLVNGEYPYTANADGFDESSGTIIVAGQAVTEDVVLSLPTYTVSFNVTVDGVAAEGASIGINSTTITTNTSGLATIELTDGDYPYTVSFNGYEDISETVTVNGADTDVQVNFTGLEDISATSRIYPNPSTGIVNIEWPTDCKITIINATGEIVEKADIKSTGTINMTNEAEGLYMIRIESGNTVTTRRLIIRQ